MKHLPRTIVLGRWAGRLCAVRQEIQICCTCFFTVHFNAFQKTALPNQPLVSTVSEPLNEESAIVHFHFALDWKGKSTWGILNLWLWTPLSGVDLLFAARHTREWGWTLSGDKDNSSFHSDPSVAAWHYCVSIPLTFQPSITALAFFLFL